jgi:hypothetical protein
MTFELHVDDGADDLRDASGLVGRCSHKTLSLKSEIRERPSVDG